MKIAGFILLTIGVISLVSFFILVVSFHDRGDLEAVNRESAKEHINTLIRIVLFSNGINILIACIGLGSDPEFVKKSRAWNAGLILAICSFFILGFTIFNLAFLTPHPP